MVNNSIDVSYLMEDECIGESVLDLFDSLIQRGGLLWLQRSVGNKIGLESLRPNQEEWLTNLVETGQLELALLIVKKPFSGDERVLTERQRWLMKAIFGRSSFFSRLMSLFSRGNQY